MPNSSIDRAKDLVLSKWPKAFAYQTSFLPPKWVIERTYNGIALGKGSTEAEAWANAANRVIDRVPLQSEDKR